MRMKTSGLAFAAAFFFLVAPGPLAAQSATALRQGMTDACRMELLAANEGEVTPASLGEWKDIIDSSLFLLFRKTELYRGTIRVLVVDDQSVRVRLYPEGTFLISSGLLDHIDRMLFENASSSPRRMRNFDSEREAMLVPFLVPEAAHFALGHQFSAWLRSGGTSLMPSDAEILDADRFSVILLRLAGFDSAVLTDWMESLEAQYGEGKADPAFSGYFARLPSPEKRMESIRNADANIDRIAGEFVGVLDALRRGTPAKDAAESLEALSDIYPGSPYIARLSAFVSHRLWLETVPAEAQILPTHFPFAVETSGGENAFLDMARATPAKSGFAFASSPPVSPSAPIPGDASLFENARLAYRTALETSEDPALASSYAVLLSRSGNAEAISTALEIASEAANRESVSSSFVARANYASLLFLTGTDFAKAQYLVDHLANGTTRSADLRFLDEGMPGDGRDLVLCHALMLRSLGDDKRAETKTAKAASLFEKSPGKGTVDLRFIRIGDKADTLSEKWGQPATILYDYYSETWIYPALSVSVLVGKEVSLVRIGTRSPVSPGGDVRTGDSREDFERFFGKSAYRAGDCEVYLKDGNRISVFYLENRIRSMTVGL